MTTFYLIRHGVTEWLNRAPARRLGKRPERTRQAHGAAHGGCHAGIPLDTIYSSPLRRCLQTAEPLARVSGVPVTPHEGLLEMNFGWFEGTRDYFRWLREKPLLRSFYRKARRTSMALTGESMERFERRVADTLQQLRDEHPNVKIALVSHYGTISQILMVSFGPPQDGPSKTSYRILPASITEIRAENGRLELARMSDTTHLVELSA